MLGDIFDCINKIIQVEKLSVQFNDYLKNITLDQYVYSQSELDNVFKKKLTVDLPPELESILKDRSSKYSIGVFPEIQRIWVIKGHSLYLWNYMTNDIFKYQAREQIIYKVGLTKPKFGTFDEDIEWVLVVVTSNQTLLYGISSYLVKLVLSKDKVFKTNTSNIIIKSIHGAHNGRIFGLGDDGHIYEIEYPVQGSVCQLKCHTEEASFGLLSYFIKQTPNAKAKSITMDEKHKALYVLTEKNDIKIVRLDDGMGTFALSEQIENINDKVNSYLLQKMQAYQTESVPASILSTIGSILTPRPFDIISIHTIPSETISFCAVTSHGCRLYFTPNLSYIRLPPYLNDQPLAIQPHQSLSSSYYNDGIFTGIINHSSSLSYLWTVDYQQFHDFSIQEVSSMVQVNNSPLAFCILPSQSSSSLTPDRFYEPIYSPIDSPTSLCLAIDHEGAHFFEKQRPIQTLYRYVVELKEFTDFKKHIDRFNKDYGITNSIALLFNILSSNQSIIYKQKDIIPYLIQTEEQLNQGSILYYTHIVKQSWNMDVLTFNEGSMATIDSFAQCKSELQNFYALLEIIKGYGTFLSTINNIQLLLSKTIQTISFILYLMENQLQFENVNETAFSELVGTDKGLAILKTLVENVITINASYNKSWVNEFLKSQCPTLFGDKQQLELFEGDEYLARAMSNEDEQQRTLLLDQSVPHYLTSFNYLSYEKQNDICKVYQKLKYYRGYVILSIQISQQQVINKDQQADNNSNNKLTLIDINHGYSMILSLLNHLKQEQQETVIDVVHMILNTSQEKQLHCLIYTWLIEHQRLYDIFQIKTPYLLDFLENEYEDKVVGLDWLWKYYDAHQDVSKATTYLIQLATKIPFISLHDRIQYIQLAIQRQPTTELETLYKSASIQQEIAQRMNAKQTDNENEKDNECMDRISSWLLDKQDLLTDFAIHYEFWDQAILLMELIHSPDTKQLYQAWTLLLKQQQANWENMKSLVCSLGKQLYPSSITFPVYLIVTLLESHCCSTQKEYSSFLEVGWIVNILIGDIDIPKSILEDAYSTLLENKISPWQDEDYKHYLEQQFDYLKNKSF
ncbi:Nup133 N terminal like-domain-containing protein [Cunninghamella echinulata]|nr:Nup133 N terminal like-domain-containing protein [Cunninghamella echinulata]